MKINNRKIWEQLYKKNSNNSVWPRTDLVSQVSKYMPNLKRKLNVLELGFGAGANIPFFLNNKFEYHGIESSLTITKKVNEKFKIGKNLKCDDFGKKISFEKKFDIIFDRAAICCNNSKIIKTISKNIYEKLEIGGLFIGIDWYSTNCKNLITGSKNIFNNIGYINFSTKKSIQKHFKKFTFIDIYEKKYLFARKRKITLSSWNFVVKKND